MNTCVMQVGCQITVVEEIADRLHQARAAKNWTQGQLAAAAGVKQSTIGNLEAGIRKNPRDLLAIAAALEVSPAWLQTGKGPRTAITSPAIDLENNPDYPAVRRVRIKVVGGITGYAIEYQDEDDGPPIVFRREWYAANGFNPAKMLAMRVTGESMVPNLRAGDLIIINTEQTQPKDGVAFVASYEGEPVVKRLVRDQGDWWLTSDNSDQRRFPRKRCDENATLIGEVVYRQTEHI